MNKKEEILKSMLNVMRKKKDLNFDDHF